MRSFFLSFVRFLIAAASPLVAQDQNSELIPVGPDKFLRWYGHADRTYFIQVSDPNDHLRKWTWAPVIETGNDADISYEVGGSADKGFFRLWFTDEPTTDPDGDDFDYDLLTNWEEVSIYQTNPLDDDSDDDGIWDDYEVLGEHGYITNPNSADTDGDGLSDEEEIFTHSSDPTASDTDGDGLLDGEEVNFWLTDPNVADSGDGDGDGLRDGTEVSLGLNPASADSDGNGINDGSEDRDLDGLSNLDELTLHLTRADQPDTDMDTMADGWEVAVGFDATVDNASTPDPSDDAGADPDNDGLTNGEESGLGTNPNDPDSDGDEVDDKTEDDQGSNPNDPNDSQPPPNGTVPVNVTFGDPSGSNSEKYRVKLVPLEGDTSGHAERFRTNRAYGEPQTDTFHLPKGAKYEVTLVHIASDPEYDGDPKPDYDYTLSITSGGDDPAAAAVIDDPEGIMGGHNESDNFFAQGKTADLYIALMTSETVATLPTDRKRKKLGVGEEVNLTLMPASLPSPTWALGGTPGTSALNPLAGISSVLTAGERASTPSTEATINGVTVKIDSEVVEPDGMVMERFPGTGIRHTNGTASTGFQARAYFSPHDVSFINIEVREGTCLATATGFIAAIPGKNGEVHANGAWIGVQQGDAQRPSLWSAIDTISTGDYAPPFGVGTFNWPIPWLFRVAGGNEKEFTIATHHESVTATGATTISKGGVSETTQANDPTSTY